MSKLKKLEIVNDVREVAQKVAGSRIGMGLSLIVFFFILLGTSIELGVMAILGGALVELTLGLASGFARWELPRDKSIAFPAIVLTILGYFYCSYASYCVYQAFVKDWWGTFCVGQLVATNDTAQYFVGKNFGKTRIFRFSPKKSLEGYIGGGFIAYICLLLTCPSLTVFTRVCLVLTGMLGDAMQSVWKRSLNIKDAGTIFGSHGGMLDRFDAHMSTFVAVSFLNYENVLPYDDEQLLLPLRLWLMFSAVVLSYRYQRELLAFIRGATFTAKKQ